MSELDKGSATARSRAIAKVSTAGSDAALPKKRVKDPNRPPLDHLVKCILFDEDPSSTDNDGARSNLEGAVRSHDEIDKALLRSAKVSVSDIQIDVSPRTDSGGFKQVWVFARNDEAVIVDLATPDYCDNESDSFVNEISAVRTLNETFRVIANRMQAEAQAVLTVMQRNALLVRQSFERMQETAAKNGFHVELRQESDHLLQEDLDDDNVTHAPSM